MKIAIVFQGNYTAEGANAAERRVRDLARGLHANSNEVFLLIPNWHVPKPTKKVDAEYQIKRLGRRNISGLNRVSYWRAIVDFAVKNNLETVLFYNTRIESLWTIKALKRKGIKVVGEFCDLHSSNYDAVSDFSSKQSLKYRLRGYFIKLGDQRLPNTMNLNIVISKYLAEHIKEIAPQVPQLRIPIIVDQETFKTDPLKNEKFRREKGWENKTLIIYSGGVYYTEGVDFLIKAIDRIRKNHPQVQLIITGKLGASKGHVPVRKMVTELKLEDNVYATDWIETEQLLEIMSAADILAAPQINHQFCEAGLPTKLAEYASLGKAIVTSKVGDVSLYFHDQENSLLIPPSNLDALEKALTKLIKNVDMRKKLGTNARNTAVASFSYQLNGEKILKKLAEKA